MFSESIFPVYLYRAQYKDSLYYSMKNCGGGGGGGGSQYTVGVSHYTVGGVPIHCGGCPIALWGVSHCTVGGVSQYTVGGVPLHCGGCPNTLRRAILNIVQHYQASIFIVL